jgi:hypothetical protein
MCRWGCIFGNQGMAEPEWCCGVMVDAVTPGWLNPTSVFEVNNVFWHLDMLRMGIWVHSFTVTIVVHVGAKFWKIHARLSPNDVVVSRLMLQTPILVHPTSLYWMYTKCFSILMYWGWAYGCTLSLLHLYRWGPNFEKSWCDLAWMMLWCHGLCYKPP